jgi:predicted alpha-1,6-mannanase (GH76 family)
MAKSAQQRFNEFLDESHETSDAVREMVDSSYDLHKSYGNAAGYLQSLAIELIAQLPKAKRAQYRDQLRRQAQKHKNELLAKTIKESA